MYSQGWCSYHGGEVNGGFQACFSAGSCGNCESPAAPRLPRPFRLSPPSSSPHSSFREDDILLKILVHRSTPSTTRKRALGSSLPRAFENQKTLRRERFREISVVDARSRVERRARGGDRRTTRRTASLGDASIRFPGARSPAGPGSPFVDAGGGRESAGAGRASSSRDAPTNARDGRGQRDGNVGSVSASESGGASTRVTTTRGGRTAAVAAGGKLELSATTCDELARVLESRRYGREASSLQEAVKTIDLVEHVLKRNRKICENFSARVFSRFYVDCFRSMGLRARGG